MPKPGKPLIESASIQCQKCSHEEREDFLVRPGETALGNLLEYAAKILQWTVATDLLLCHACTIAPPPRKHHV